MDFFLAINERGQVVRSSATDAGAAYGEPISRAFFGTVGAMTVLGTLEGRAASAAGINERGQIVGTSATRARDEFGGWISHGFVWQSGVMTDLGTLGGEWSAANVINDRGQVAGESQTETQDDHAFLWDNGKMRDLGTLRRQYLFGGRHVSVSGINEQGEVVGSSRSATGSIHAVLAQKGKMIDLGTLGGTDSFASAVNARGHVIGDSDTGTGIAGTGEGHGFVWEHGEMTDLGSLGFGTNFLGQGVGVGAELAVDESRRDQRAWRRGRRSTTEEGVAHMRSCAAERTHDRPRHPQGDVESGAVALNDHGQIIGSSKQTAASSTPSSGRSAAADGSVVP